MNSVRELAPGNFTLLFFGFAVGGLIRRRYFDYPEMLSRYCRHAHQPFTWANTYESWSWMQTKINEILEWAGLDRMRMSFIVITGSCFGWNFSTKYWQKRIENYPLNGMLAAFIFKPIFIPCVAASSLHLLSNLLDEKTNTAYLLFRGNL